MRQHLVSKHLSSFKSLPCSLATMANDIVPILVRVRIQTWAQFPSKSFEVSLAHFYLSGSLPDILRDRPHHRVPHGLSLAYSENAP